jgi:hypothetical protein
MVRIRHAWLVAGALITGLALVPACKKDGKKTDTAADKVAGGMAEKPGEPAAAGDDLSLLPVDSELVLGVNFAQVQQSSLWKTLVEPKLLTGETQARIAEFKTKCGIDPMSSMKSLSLGMKNVGGASPDGVIVFHGVDKAKSLACIDTMKEELAKQGAEVTRDGDVVLAKGKTGEQAAFTFVNDTTGVAVLGTNANTAGAKAAAAGGSALKTSPAFVEMYSKVKTSDSIWFLANGRLLDKGAAVGMKFKAVYGSLNVTDGLSLDLRLLHDTPEAATQFAAMANGQVQQATKMFDKIEVAPDGAEVKVSVVLSKPKLDAMIAQFGPMLGAFGGMGGP